MDEETTEATKKADSPRVPRKQIIPYVFDAMADDDDGRDKYNNFIQAAYEKADEATKKVIDDIFAALCGWSMDTIIKEADPIEEEEEEDE